MRGEGGGGEGNERGMKLSRDGRSYGFFLPEASLFCRPQTPRRMIHKSPRSPGGFDFLPPSLSLSLTHAHIHEKKTDSVSDRKFPDPRKQARARQHRESRRRVERCRRDKGATKAPDEKFVNATRARRHEYCITSGGQPHVRRGARAGKLPAARARGS